MTRRRRPRPPEWRQEQIHIDDISYLGEGVGRLDGEVVFVAYGLPGEDVRAEIIDERKQYRRGRTVEVLTASPERVTAPCPFFGTCGGCQLQHLPYPNQLAQKKCALVEQLRRIGGFEEPPVREPIGSPVPWYYRNHVRFSTRRDGSLGFTRSHSHWVLPVDYCLISLPPINAALRALQGHGAGLHQVAIRYGARTGDLLVSPRIPGDHGVATGQEYLEEELLGRRFRISPSSFFQVNTRPDWRVLPDSIQAPWLGAREGEWSQAEMLALQVLDWLEPTGNEFVVDAYGGVGVFALLAADRVGRVIGIEESASAVANARQNAKGFDNVEFIQQKTEIALPALAERPDAAILDPARPGCAPEVIAALLERRPDRIIYVSCDPATLARDLRRLVDGGYDLVAVQPVDMFPQTHHIESVSLLIIR